MSGIIEMIEGFIPMDDLIQSAFDFINSLGILEQVVGALVLGIIVLLGSFELVKKLSKIIIFVVIIAAAWFVWSNGYLDGIIGW